MKRSIALAIFGLIVPLVFSVKDEPVVVQVNVGSRINLGGDPVEGKIVQCTASRSGADELPQLFTVVREDFCEIDVSQSKLDHVGAWILTTRTKDYQSYQKEFLIFMSQERHVKPGSYILASEGEWVSVWLDGNSSDITACTLKSPMNEEVYDLLNGEYENVSRYGEGCGVRVRASAERAGEYELQRTLGIYVTEQSYFRIVVSNNNNNENGKITHRRFNLGEPAELKVYREDIAFCQFTRPDGTSTRLQYGECFYPISAVSKLHEGVWRVVYALRTKLELLHQEFHVTVWDTESLTALQIPGPGRKINLLCRAGVEVLKYCSFKRPDNKIMNLPVAVGNDNYSYYGDGYNDEHNSRYYGDCGITIHEPTKIDYGSWECEMGILKGEVVVPRGAIIRVVEARDQLIYNVESSRVVVKSGDSFKIRCKVNRLLDYCWLTAPNGTMYTVLPEAGSASSLKYDGNGFYMGDCGAVVDRATPSDNGNWTCHLGVSASGELENNVSVRVTDSYLIPAEIVHGKNGVKLSCRTYLEEKGTPKYCRWIRPDGSGLNRKDAAGRYATNTTIHSCDLTIFEIGAEDIGRWTCAAMLTGTPKAEQWATIELESTYAPLAITSIVSIVFGSVLLTVTLMGSFLAAMYIYKRRKCDEKKSYLPPLYNPDIGNSQTCCSQTNPTDVTMSKDYKY